MVKEMSEAAREAQREYHRRYRKTHRDQIRENRLRYWERKAAAQRTDNTGASEEGAESEAKDEPKEND